MKIASNPYLSLSFDSGEFASASNVLVRHLSKSTLINRGRVHAQDVSTRPEFATYELANVMLTMTVPILASALQDDLAPNLPWAEDHFQERVGGKPLNPSPSEAWWPYAQQGNKQHKDGVVFSHTYPERMWPKHASEQGHVNQWESNIQGIRYEYGDLNDLISLLVRDPFTRQAFLPIWFPEDTGAVDGQRVPCSLGYHFIRRGVDLDCQYYMRSCDMFRHFTDDTYMAARLMQWVCEQIWAQQHHTDESFLPYPGSLTMHISNLHCFKGDEHKFAEVRK